jgi:hypothetical protein
MVIPRLQLFELEDQPWFPSVVRDLATDYLRFVERRFRLHMHALPILARATQASGAERVIDLCSGGAGPVPALVDELGKAGIGTPFVLTDRFPNLEAFRGAKAEGNGQIDFVARPIDARDIPGELVGLRTFFNAFHHFAPSEGLEILTAAAEANQPIAVLEIPERSLASLLPLLLTPIFVWLATPFIRPFSLRRLLFTYLIPVVPLTCLWDGIVSQLRAYRPDELQAMAEQVPVRGFAWEAGVHRAPSVPGRLTYLLGWPVQ